MMFKMSSKMNMKGRTGFPIVVVIAFILLSFNPGESEVAASLLSSPYDPMRVCQAPTSIPSLPSSCTRAANLTLRQVIAVTRHGDRVPDHVLNAYPDLTDVAWECSLSFIEQPDLSGYYAGDTRFKKEYLPHRQILRGNCASGQLTTKGYRQHYDLGQLYSSVYASLLPKSKVVGSLYVRSTDYPRTMMSAQGNVNGILSHLPSNGVASNITVKTMDSDSDNMYSNYYICPYTTALLDSRMSSDKYQVYLKSIRPIQYEIAELGYYGGHPEQVSIGGFCDICTTRTCHGFSLPPGVTRTLFQASCEAAQWQSGFIYASEETAMWDIGSFWEELVNHMNVCVHSVKSGGTTCSPSFLLFSGHESTLYPMLASLQAYNGYFIPYASHMEMELYEGDGHVFYIRLLFNGDDILLPGKSISPSSCPALYKYSDFLDYIRPFLAPIDYLQSCHT